MSRGYLSLLGIIVLATASLFAPALASADKVDITIADWKFNPSTIVLHVGQPQTLHFVSKEGVHGIASDALGIPQTEIAPGDGVDVLATPKKPGTYVLHCAIFCGAGHPNLALTVKVEP